MSKLVFLLSLVISFSFALKAHCFPARKKVSQASCELKRADKNLESEAEDKQEEITDFA